MFFFLHLCRGIHCWWKWISWLQLKHNFLIPTIPYPIVSLNTYLTVQRILGKSFVVIELKTLLMWWVWTPRSFLYVSLLYFVFSGVDRSIYLQFKMREPQMCNVVCRKILDKKTAKAFKEKIDDEYRVNMWGSHSGNLNYSIPFLRWVATDIYDVFVTGFWITFHWLFP